jgi:hypothetical protein
VGAVLWCVGPGPPSRYQSSPMASSGQALSVPLPEPNDGRRVPSAVPLVGAGILYLAVATGFFATIWFTPGGPSSTALGVGGDPQLAIWFLRWQAFALAHGHNLLFTTYLDAPQGVNLMWNTTAPLMGVVLAPVTLTLGGVFAYNLAETLGLAGSAMAAFVMIRRYVRATDAIGTVAALVGGAVYGFSPYMAAHALGHPPAVTLFTVPLMLLLVDDLFVRQKGRTVRAGVALGVLAAVQLLLWEELLLAEALVGAVGIVVLLAFSAVARPAEPLSTVIGQRWRYAARGLTASFITFLVLASGPLAIQFFGPQTVHGAVWAPNQFVTDLLAFIVPTPLQAVTPAFAARLSEHFSATIYEWSGYLGLPLVALLGYAIRSLWSRGMTRPAALAGIFAVTGVFVALLAMGPLINVAGHTMPLPVALLALATVFWVRRRVADKGVRRAARIILWTFLAVWGATIFVPIVSDVIPARLMLFVFLFAGLILAIWLDHALRKARAAGRSLAIRALPLALAGLALVPLIPRQPFPTMPLAVPSFFTTPALVDQLPSGSVALVAPFAYDWRLAVPMLWQSKSGMRFRMPEGFAWIPGPSYVPHRSGLGDAMAGIAKSGSVPDMTSDARLDYARDLRAWQVQTVIVGPMGNQDQMVRFFTELFGRPPSEEGGVFVWFGL